MRALTDAERHQAMLRDITRAPAPFDCPVCGPGPLVLVVVVGLIAATVMIASLMCCPGAWDAVAAYFGGAR